MAPPSTPGHGPTADDFDHLIPIEVGQDSDKRTFKAWKGVLCFYSGYFAASLNGRFLEAQDQLVRLPTEDAKIFELFHHWMADRRFYDSTLSAASLMDYMTLFKLWVFGDAHHIPMLQNDVADVIEDKMAGGKDFDGEAIAYAWTNTAEGSKLRLLIATGLGDLLNWAFGGSVTALEKEEVDTVIRLAETVQMLGVKLGSPRRFVLKSNVAPSSQPPTVCRYHVHEDGIECRGLLTTDEQQHCEQRVIFKSFLEFLNC